jgi:hypothetical protein
MTFFRRTESMPSKHLPATVDATNGGLVRLAHPESLAAWIRLYGTLEAGANAVKTVRAKAADLKLFMDFFAEKVRSDHLDAWTKSVTAAFLRHLEHHLKRKATTINRVLATLRHCARWIHRHRPFPAGDPCQGIAELTIDEPEWKGLKPRVATTGPLPRVTGAVRACPDRHPAWAAVAPDRVDEHAAIEPAVAQRRPVEGVQRHGGQVVRHEVRQGSRPIPVLAAIPLRSQGDDGTAQVGMPMEQAIFRPSREDKAIADILHATHPLAPLRVARVLLLQREPGDLDGLVHGPQKPGVGVQRLAATKPDLGMGTPAACRYSAQFGKPVLPGVHPRQENV